VQANNSTRVFEYPWVVDVAGPGRGMRVLDIGGGLAGLQFVLARLGCRVDNVDPGLEAEGIGFPCDQEHMALMNRAFGTSVRLHSSTLPEAGLDAGAYDLAISVSTIEHLAEHELEQTLDEALRLLRPGGLLVLTVDLFLNLQPFTRRSSNEYGRNYAIGALLQRPGIEIVVGDPVELYGDPSFDADAILEGLEQYLIGTFYPVLVQCIVLRKTA
jgi:SAM-dependent methyltransferase